MELVHKQDTKEILTETPTPREQIYKINKKQSKVPALRIKIIHIERA